MRRLFLLAVFWGSMPAIFIDPFYGIVYYHLINIIRPEQLMWGDASAVGRLFLAVQAFSFLSWIIHKDKLTPEYTPLPLQNKLLWFIALMMTIASYQGVNWVYAWYWTSNFWKTTIFCFVMSKAVNSIEKVEKLYTACLVTFVLLAIWGIQQKLGGNSRMEGLGGDMLPDVNSLAAVFIMYFPLTYYAMFNRKKKIRLFVGMPAFLIFMIFIMFGGSRGAFLGMVFCMMLIFWKSPGIQKIKMVVTFAVLGVLLLGLLIKLAPSGFFEEYTARLATIFGQEDEFTGEVKHEGSAAGRTALWKGALYLYKNHSDLWLFGFGMYCYAQTYFKYIDEIAEVLTEQELLYVVHGGHGGKQIHNTYLSLLMGGGAAVLLPWLFLIAYSWWQVRRIPKKYPRIINGIDVHNYARALEVGIMGYCLCIGFLNMEFIDLFYWHLTMTGVLVNICKAKVQREELGQEDGEYWEEAVGNPAYAYKSY